MRAALATALVLVGAGCAADATSGDRVAEERQTVGLAPRARLKKRVTGADLDTAKKWQVAGTDLGIPYVLENGSIGYLFGDTFSSPFPGGAGWRSPVLLRSATHPKDGIVFDSAAKVRGEGFAPEIFPNAKNKAGTWNPPTEFTIIPNDGISFPETKRQIVSFMSINNWNESGGANWRTGYASLAYSDNGNDFKRVPDLAWANSESNTDPFQMWTMQRDGDWVYVYSVRAGRQRGPMMLQRVKWDRMFDKMAYECLGGSGGERAWGKDCTPLLEGHICEPSVRRLEDGTWAMAYLSLSAGPVIVSRTAKSPEGPWSNEKIQLTWGDAPGLYGGFIHPWSKSGPEGLHMMVSQWTFAANGASTAYHVAQYVGSL